MIWIVSLSLSTSLMYAQDDDLLGDLESESKDVEVFTQPAFKGARICNLQSTKIASKGDFYFNVSHRFGNVKDGIQSFFGLDNANTKIQLVYGATKWMQIGISRESFRKTYAGHAKFKIMSQSTKKPLNLSAYSTIEVNTELQNSNFPNVKFFDRLSYATQFLVSRSFWNRLSLQIAPTYVRQNLTYEANGKHDVFALAAGFRVKVSKRISINLDYAYNFMRPKNSIFRNPLTIGIDIETGGHVFQLLFSNGQPNNTVALMTSSNGNWLKGDIFFGFNLVRVFGTKKEGKKKKKVKNRKKA